MSDVAASVRVAAPQSFVWQRLTHWADQSEWMIATRVRPVGAQQGGPGDRIEAFTGWASVGFLDRMVVTDWVEGRRVRVEHTGRVVRGSGTFEVVTDGVDRSRVVWREHLIAPGGRVGQAVLRLAGPFARAMLSASLRRFAAGVSSDWSGA